MLPALVAFQKEKGISNSFCVFPKCYGTYSDAVTKRYALVLEDLNSKGSEMKSKSEPLDFHHASVVFKELGRFHALTFAVRAQNLELFNEIKQLRSTGIKVVAKYGMEGSRIIN